ncbi:unnamed protein product [Trifolium pratense]|uniref:Uncharacterized protein n=1 Tax=Trifolium pratense TaxID=57577 RepID=A0ACB0L5H8_TRIPR|nr:unnamed protein product [Trifolium pratense]
MLEWEEELLLVTEIFFKVEVEALVIQGPKLANVMSQVKKLGQKKLSSFFIWYQKYVDFKKMDAHVHQFKDNSAKLISRAVGAGKGWYCLPIFEEN